MECTNISKADPWSYPYVASSPLSSPLSFSSRPSSPGSQPSFSGRSTPCLSGASTPGTEVSEYEAFGPIVSLPEADYVLVVGGLGYIGSHTAWELLKAGHNVVVIDNMSNSYRNVLERIQELMDKHYPNKAQMPLLDFYEADYRNMSIMTSILQRYTKSSTLKRQQSATSAPEATRPSTKSAITSVIHFAAYKAVEESIYQPLKYYSNNVAGLIDFCTLLQNFDIKTLVFSSSATVYGELANKGGRLREECCTHKTQHWTDNDGEKQITLSGSTGLTNPYGRTKWMSEAILSDLAASDPEWTIYALRYFNPIGCDSSGILGEDPRGTPNNLMPIVIRVMEGKLPELNVFGQDWDTQDGTAIRDFIHVSDLARGHVAAICTGTKADSETGFHTINLGTGNGSSVKEVVDTMSSISGKPIQTNASDRRVGDVGICIADPAKAASMLGWYPQKTLEDSCRDIVHYLRTHD